MKLCESCLRTFVGGCNGNCPHCGGTEWRHVDQRGAPVPSIGHDTLRRVVEGVPMENGEVLMITRREPADRHAW